MNKKVMIISMMIRNFDQHLVNCREVGFHLCENCIQCMDVWCYRNITPESLLKKFLNAVEGKKPSDRFCIYTCDDSIHDPEIPGDLDMENEKDKLIGSLECEKCGKSYSKEARDRWEEELFES